MGNICTSGIPAADIAELNMSGMSTFPPWIALWPAFWMDVFSAPFGLRDSWRQRVPFGLADPGRWLSEDWEIVGIVKLLPDPFKRSPCYA